MHWHVHSADTKAGPSELRRICEVYWGEVAARRLTKARGLGVKKPSGGGACRPLPKLQPGLQFIFSGCNFPMASAHWN